MGTIETTLSKHSLSLSLKKKILKIIFIFDRVLYKSEIKFILFFIREISYNEIIFNNEICEFIKIVYLINYLFNELFNELF